MGKEDQVEEREVLESIFPEEITDIAEDNFRISVTLDITNDDGDDSEPPTILISIKYPESYPDEAPEVDLLPTTTSSSHPYFNLSEDKDRLLRSLEETIYENIGMAMVFTLYSTLKENAEQLVADRQQETRDAREKLSQAQEEEENKKFNGTPVTPKTFQKWRDDFVKEMAELKLKEEEAEEAAEKKRNKGKETVNKLTGRQLWERGLAGKVEEEDDGDDGIPVGGLQKLKVAA